MGTESADPCLESNLTQSTKTFWLNKEGKDRRYFTRNTKADVRAPSRNVLASANTPPSHCRTQS